MSKTAYFLLDGPSQYLKNERVAIDYFLFTDGTYLITQVLLLGPQQSVPKIYLAWAELIGSTW